MIGKKRFFLNGSYTIEAALLMPLILFMLLLIFYLSFLLYNRVVFQAYCIRSAMQIHYMPGDTNTLIEKRSGQILAEGIKKNSIGAKEIEITVTVGKNGSETQSVSEMDVISFGGPAVDSQLWGLKESWKTQRMNPADIFATTRKLFVYSEILQDFMEEKEE